MVSDLRDLNFFSSKNKFIAVTMIIGHTPELKRSSTTITIKKKKLFDDFHRKPWNSASRLDLPSCLSKGSHETLGRTESNTLGRELSTGFWREDVVYILDPVFILDEVLPLPGACPRVISFSSRFSLREAASCSLHVKLDAGEQESACQRLSSTGSPFPGVPRLILVGNAIWVMGHSLDTE